MTKISETRRELSWETVKLTARAIYNVLVGRSVIMHVDFVDGPAIVNVELSRGGIITHCYIATDKVSFGKARQAEEVP